MRLIRKGLPRNLTRPFSIAALSPLGMFAVCKQRQQSYISGRGYQIFHRRRTSLEFPDRLARSDAAHFSVQWALLGRPRFQILQKADSRICLDFLPNGEPSMSQSMIKRSREAPRNDTLHPSLLHRFTMHD